jgi:hypothetical protein
MGLDQYLTAKTIVVGGTHALPESRKAYEQVLTAVGSPTVRESSVPIATVDVQVGYWRKENAIHDWFVQNCQDGNDDCRESPVTREQLAELRELCEKVLADNSLASDLLPTCEGFFFGTTDYDEWYFAGLRDTVEIVNTVLNDKGYDNFEFYYQSSW